MESSMKTGEGLPHDGHRLIQVGVVLFLLALLVGLGVRTFAVPRLALSAHLIAIMQGTFLMVTGLLWPKLRFTRPASRAGYILGIYGCFAAWTANMCGAIWGAGASMVPMAAGAARGNAFQEGAIKALLVTAAVSLIAFAILILWGLRRPARSEPGEGRVTLSSG